MKAKKMWVTNPIPIFNLKLLDVIDSVHVALQYAFYLAIEKSIKNAAHQHDLSLSTVATVVVDIIRMGTHNVPYIYNACTSSRIIDLNLLCSTHIYSHVREGDSTNFCYCCCCSLTKTHQTYLIYSLGKQLRHQTNSSRWKIRAICIQYQHANAQVNAAAMNSMPWIYIGQTSIRH